MELFPDIGLDISQLWRRRESTLLCQFSVIFILILLLAIWNDSKARRTLFEQYAAVHGFDPYRPEHWYCQSKELIMAFKV